MAWFWKSKEKALDKEIFEGPPRDIGWVRSPKNQFYNFLNLDPDEIGLKGVSGVYVVWQGGIRPEWVYIGHTPNLAGAFDAIYDNPEIMDPSVIDPVLPDEDGKQTEEEVIQPIAVFPPGVGE